LGEDFCHTHTHSHASRKHRCGLFAVSFAGHVGRPSPYLWIRKERFDGWLCLPSAALRPPPSTLHPPCMRRSGTVWRVRYKLGRRILRGRGGKTHENERGSLGRETGRVPSGTETHSTTHLHCTRPAGGLQGNCTSELQTCGLGMACAGCVTAGAVFFFNR